MLPYYDTYTGDGATTQFDVTFSYLSRDHVKALIGGAEQAFTWVSASRIELAAAPAGGAELLIVRETPIDEQETIFNDGAVLTAEDLNRADRQLLFHQQEVDGRVAQSADIQVAYAETLAAAAAASDDADAAAASVVQAEAAASDAETAAVSSASSATTATTKAGDASASAATATTKAAEASASAASSNSSQIEAAASEARADEAADRAEAAAATAEGYVAPGVELIQDTVAGMLVNGGGINLAYDDASGLLNISLSEFDGTYFADLGGDPTDNVLLAAALNGKANAAHTHAIADVTGLQTALNGKAAAAHTHPQSDITNLTSDLAAINAAITANATSIGGKASKFLSETSSANSLSLDDTLNNGVLRMTGATTRTITAGASPSAGFSCIIRNRGTVNMTFSCAGGVYLKGATTTVTSVTLAPGAHVSVTKESDGKYTLDGSGAS